MPTPPTISRDPQAAPRTLRFMDEVRSLLNSLVRNGILELLSPGNWGMANLFFTGHGTPSNTLGYPGDYYLDIDGNTLYKKV